MAPHYGSSPVAAIVGAVARGTMNGAHEPGATVSPFDETRRPWRPAATVWAALAVAASTARYDVLWVSVTVLTLVAVIGYWLVAALELRTLAQQGRPQSHLPVVGAWP